MLYVSTAQPRHKTPSCSPTSSRVRLTAHNASRLAYRLGRRKILPGGSPDNADTRTLDRLLTRDTGDEPSTWTALKGMWAKVPLHGRSRRGKTSEPTSPPDSQKTSRPTVSLPV